MGGLGRGGGKVDTLVGKERIISNESIEGVLKKKSLWRLGWDSNAIQHGRGFEGCFGKAGKG